MCFSCKYIFNQFATYKSSPNNQRTRKYTAPHHMNNNLSPSSQENDSSGEYVIRTLDAVSLESLRRSPGANSLKPFHQDEYQFGEKLGCETRLVEFKRGQGKFLENHLKPNFARYASAFLNTEGGTFIVGVDDNGIVQGVEIDRSLEDMVRRDIDEMMSHMNPPVLPNMYKIHFCKVTHPLHRTSADLRVLEVCVKRGPSDKLYETGRGEVYVRRDGSVQKLGAGAIQEYTRNVVLKQEKEKKKVMNHITQLHSRLEKVEQDVDAQKRSRFCIIT